LAHSQQTCLCALLRLQHLRQYACRHLTVVARGAFVRCAVEIRSTKKNLLLCSASRQDVPPLPARIVSPISCTLEVARRSAAVVMWCSCAIEAMQPAPWTEFMLDLFAGARGCSIGVLECTSPGHQHPSGVADNRAQVRQMTRLASCVHYMLAHREPVPQPCVCAGAAWK
jgi:hypothetical protein